VNRAFKPPTWQANRRLLITGAVIYTPQYGFTAAAPNSLLVDGGIITWIGNDAVKYRDDADTVVDVEGAFVLPGFVDAHVHTTNTGIILMGLDLSATTSLVEALTLISAAAKSARGGVLIGHGWDETRWPEGRAPTRTEVDRATWGSVAYLSRIDVHSAVASSALLAALPGIEQVAGYRADGLLSRSAHHLAREKALDSIGSGQRASAHRITRSHASAHGIVSMHEMAGPTISSADDLRELLELAANEPGPLVTGYWGELASQGGIERAKELGAVGVAGDLFIDGALGSRTACLRSHYEDEPSTEGAQYVTAEEIEDHVIRATETGLQAGFHVIGDKATDIVITGFRAAASRCGAEAIQAGAHRLEHAEMLDDDHIAAMNDLGITASMQSMFDSLWGAPGGMYQQRLGAIRAAKMNRLADISSAGVLLALGSDSPVTVMDPWLAVRAATQHHQPKQRLSFDVAIKAHTEGGWAAAGTSGVGQLVVGAPAHLAIWESQESTGPVLDLSAGGPSCLRTIVSGATVFDNGSLAEQ
jgi:hypothetical protein